MARRQRRTEEVWLNRAIPHTFLTVSRKRDASFGLHVNIPCLMDSIRSRTSCSPASPDRIRSIGSRPPNRSCGVRNQRSGSSTTSSASRRMFSIRICIGSSAGFGILQPPLLSRGRGLPERYRRSIAWRRQCNQQRWEPDVTIYFFPLYVTLQTFLPPSSTTSNDPSPIIVTPTGRPHTSGPASSGTQPVRKFS